MASSPGASIADLQSVLQDLHNHPYPTVASPDGVSRRASVAVIIRISPHYDHWPSSADAASAGLSIRDASLDAGARVLNFFSQPWVRHGTPEVLFIKRAARVGDRWQGHVAYPGGRRDPEDADDLAAAIRETSEEVGLDLRAESGNAVNVGNLPQRIVTTSWGRVPLMVLCPYVFLLINHEIPPLRLQPTEVASTHWVPLAALQNPALRTNEYQDVSNRLAKQEKGLKRWMWKVMLGQMEYAAIRLVPSESVYCSSIQGFLPATTVARGTLPPQLTQPLHLWGLTLTIMADLLDMLPPHNALDLWSFPTFTPPDVRFIIWLTTYRFTSRMRTDIRNGLLKPATIELGLDQVPNRIGTPGNRSQDGTIDGLGNGGRHRHGDSSSAINMLLEEYYPLLRTGIGIAMGVRITAALAVAYGAYRKFRRP